MGAAFNCNPKMVKTLIEAKAKIEQCDEDGWNCLHFTAWNAGKPDAAECAQLFLTAGAKVQERTSICHAEEPEDIKREGSTASEIVHKRMALMNDKEVTCCAMSLFHFGRKQSF